MSALAVSAIKRYSHIRCPWDLQAFGGAAAYVSNWAWGMRDSGSRGGFFAFRQTLPATAWLCWTVAGGMERRSAG